MATLGVRKRSPGRQLLLFPVSLRRLTGVFSLLVMSHLLVAQSLFACSPRHHAGGQSDLTHHCHGSGVVVHTHNVPAHMAPGGTQPTHQVPDAPACCSLLASCGSMVYVPALDRGTQTPALDVAVSVDRIDAPLSRAIAPEPPPPKQLGH
jgi:hypothetical protein